MGRRYGVALLVRGARRALQPCEVAELQDVDRDAQGNIRVTEIDLGRKVKNDVQVRLEQRGIKVTIVDKTIGYELRCAPPIPYDAEYARDLGYAAVNYLLKGGSGAMITIQGGDFRPVPFDEVSTRRRGAGRRRRGRRRHRELPRGARLHGAARPEGFRGPGVGRPAGRERRPRARGLPRVLREVRGLRIVMECGDGMVGRLTLSCLLAGALLTPTRSQDAPPAGLQSWARARAFYVGSAVDVSALEEDPDYRATLAREFNLVVAENAFKFEHIQPEQGRYDFARADALADFAASRGMELRGHTLVWHRQLPRWLAEGRFSRDEVAEILKDHITTLVGRYRGKVWAWDVVNEAVADEGGKLRPDSFWYRSLGPDYIRLAFEWARAADPGARLYYNDYSAEGMSRKSDAVYRLARELAQGGALIDGVGWQMHVAAGFKAGDDHRKNARRLAALGLELSITELDVRVNMPTTPEGLQRQAASYREAANLCLAEPNCRALVLWGFSDKYSWVPGDVPRLRRGFALRRGYAPKPAYASLRAALQGASTALPQVTGAAFDGNKLTVTGSGFDPGAVVVINGVRQKTAAEKRNPTTVLKSKDAGKRLLSGQTARLQVLNPGGRLSPEFSLARS